MGELFPVILVVAVVLVVVAAMMMKSSLRGKQVVRPLEQEEIVTRIKIRLDPIRAKMLASQLQDAGAEAWDKHVVKYVDHNDADDRIIRFVIEPKEYAKAEKVKQEPVGGVFPAAQPA